MAEEDDIVSTYQIRPKTQNKFQPGMVKQLIQESLNEELEGKKYSADESGDLSKLLTETITDKLQELSVFKRYKYVVQVVLGERRGQGVKVGSRCLWDADTDNYASAVFLSDSIFCVGTVFGVYYY